MAGPPRRLIFGLVGLLALVIAVGTPTIWWATRPAGSVGAPIGAPAPAVPTSTPRTIATSSGAATATSAGPIATTSLTRPTLPRPARSAVTDRAGRARLVVGSLGISAPIIAVGVRPDSTMAIPEQVQDVGWYKFGPAPGSPVGSAVLAGHVDSAAQGKGALFDLRRVAVGARITVTLNSGRTVAYRVTGRELFVKRRLPTEELFARDGAPRLVIITCGGPFISKLSSYRDNLVVAADPIR